MNVALIAGCYPPDVKGGGEISTELLADILTSAGCTVSVLTCSSEPRSEVIGEVAIRRIVSPNVYWDYISQTSRLKKLAWHILENVNPHSTKKVREFLDQTKPDIMVTSTIENFGAGAWRAAHHASVPSCHILRSYYPFCFRGNAVREKRNCKGQCGECALLSSGRKAASQLVDGVVGISRYVLSRHLQHGFFSRAAIAVIGEPIAALEFKHRRQEKAPKRFGYLGVLSADKGLQSLAAAWAMSAPNGCTLSIAGTGKAEFVRALRPLFPEGVEFTGWVDSSSYLEGLDYLIVPSIWNEPFGRIVIEAFAKGVPVLGSRIGGIAETVVDGRNGYTFTPNDPNDISRLLHFSAGLSVSDYQILSTGATLSAERYEARSVGQAHIDFYRRIRLVHHKLE